MFFRKVLQYRLVHKVDLIHASCPNPRPCGTSLVYPTPPGFEGPKESFMVCTQKLMRVNHNLNPTPENPLCQEEINMMSSTVRLAGSTGRQKLL